MSTDYHIVCFDCKKVGPTIASGSGFYGFKVWGDSFEEMRKFLGHKENVGFHEHHDLRICNTCAIPFEIEEG